MKLFQIMCISLFCFAIPNQFAHAYTDGKVVKPDQDIENVKVEGRRPRGFYLTELRKYQREFADNFNEIVNDSDMEVVCQLERQTGSNIKTQRCRPRFIHFILAKETQWASTGGSATSDLTNLLSTASVKNTIRKEFKEFKTITAKLLNEHPDLASTYMKMQDAMDKYNNYYTRRP